MAVPTCDVPGGLSNTLRPAPAANEGEEVVESIEDVSGAHTVEHRDRRINRHARASLECGRQQRPVNAPRERRPWIACLPMTRSIGSRRRSKRAADADALALDESKRMQESLLALAPWRERLTILAQKGKDPLDADIVKVPEAASQTQFAALAAALEESEAFVAVLQESKMATALVAVPTKQTSAPRQELQSVLEGHRTADTQLAAIAASLQASKSLSVSVVPSSKLESGVDIGGVSMKPFAAISVAAVASIRASKRLLALAKQHFQSIQKERLLTSGSISGSLTDA